jgi:hypothetical protein
MKTILERTIQHEVKIPLSGAEIAELFWSLDEHGQSDFFNRLGRESHLPMQLQYVTDCDRLDRNGRHAMTRIGEYGPANTEAP